MFWSARARSSASASRSVAASGMTEVRCSPIAIDAGTAARHQRLERVVAELGEHRGLGVEADADVATPEGVHVEGRGG